ncbi:unnamed protein product, partial [Ixodes pacificus]
SQLISTKGYPVEDHEVVTRDGYVIAMQRIPRGRNESLNATLSNKTSVFLQPGMLASSTDYVQNFPNQSLAFILADAGYDVWLGNSRGNMYSRHVDISRDDSAFWDFSLDEIIAEDLPSMIDTVLNITGKQKVQFIGWSQGVLVLFGLLSEKPEYNKKIILFSAMGPVPYFKHTRVPMKLLTPFADIIAGVLRTVGNGQLAVPTLSRTKLANTLCGNSIGNYICTFILSFINGVDPMQLNKTRLAVYYSHSPSGASVNHIQHIAQLVRCDCFRKYDLGIIKNLARYGKLKPPHYDLSRADLPVALYWSKGDRFATEKDVARLRNELSNVVEYYQVPEEQFTHFDFGWGINAEPIVYRQMMRVMDKYRQAVSWKSSSGRDWAWTYGGSCYLILCLIIPTCFIVNFRNYKPSFCLAPTIRFSVSELISSKGYPVEDHNVITKDGYVLAVQRIPRGRGENANELSSSKTPVLFHHGFLGAASDYVINFPHQSLGFILADAGYDVWLGNFRGNTYSSHINLSRDAREFWDFSADEMASEDLPSAIDTVLKVTGKEKLQYIGWSQGALIMFALLSEKPEYNKKISLFSAMAPAVYLGHFHAPFVLLLTPPLSLVEFIFLNSKKGIPSFKDKHIAANGVCGSNIGDEICTALYAYLIGLDSNQLNKSRLAVYFSHAPAGASINNALHLAQLVRCNCLEKFDYGITKNIAKYGKVIPPGYTLSRAEVPVAIYWSKGDWFAAEQDVAHLQKELTNVVEYYQVPEEKFTHFDFGWGINAEPILYRKMMSVMEDFRT